MIAAIGRFYQMGFVASDLDGATEALAKRFGIARFRRKAASAWLETAHAWIGDTMIEVMLIKEGAPELYAGYAPVDPAEIRLHHMAIWCRTIPPGPLWKPRSPTTASPHR